MKVMVTGATGFVGSHTAKALKDAGHEVRLLVRSQAKADRVCSDLGFSVDEVVEGDITDKAAVEKAVAGCDAVIHSAAMVSTAEKHAEMMQKTNVDGTQYVMDASLAAGIKKIIYVSSISALFDVDMPVINEESPVAKPKSPYGRTKGAAEEYVRQLQSNGAPIVITYPVGIVGSNDPGLSEPHFGLRMFLGQFTFTSSTGMQFVNVKDVAKSHQLILEKVDGADRFILGGHYYSWPTLLGMSRKLTGRALPALPIPGPLLRAMGSCADVFIKLTGIEIPVTGEGMTYASRWVQADSSKIKRELDFEFIDQEETLADAYRWLYETNELSAKKVGLIAKG